ncbi:MAG: hypothetical protein KatS3mg068_1213 [Candidatus Sericytochromatia bacterium]|nr:MAG: hypothetical protein KatS3mg068_1213 [Candidatus Sericytochromatia bacterium]
MKKKVLILLTSILIFACSNIFGPEVTGVWIISGIGEAQMRLQQNGNQVVGLAYYQGQLEGQVIGQISGNQIILQVRKAYSGNVTYQGIVSSDSSSMQLKRSDGQIITMFRAS